MLTRHNLFDDQLRRLHATKFIDVEPIGQLHGATNRQAGLVECDRVDDDGAVALRPLPGDLRVAADRAGP